MTEFDHETKGEMVVFFNFFSVFEKKIFSSISYLLTSFDVFKYVIPHCDCN